MVCTTRRSTLATEMDDQHGYAARTLEPIELESPKCEMPAESLSGIPKLWRQSADGTGIERTFKFKTFKAAWEFMNNVAAEAKRLRHHPEWSNIYNTVFIRWSTHHIGGLSSKDFDLASICDELARPTVIESTELSEETNKSADLRSLAEKAV